MIIIDSFKQGDAAWNAARIGNPGASSFKRIVTTNGEPSKSRREYMHELAGEIITGQKTIGYSNKRMDEGLILEAESRSLYEFVYDVDVIQVALCYKDEKKMYHCSPDGIMPDLKGGFETKDAIPKVQVGRLLKGTLPTEHFSQCQGSLLVTGYDYWDFQSYCRGMEALTVRVYPDEKFLQKLETALNEFCQELAYTVRDLKNRG